MAANANPYRNRSDSLIEQTLQNKSLYNGLQPPLRGQLDTVVKNIHHWTGAGDLLDLVGEENLRYVSNKTGKKHAIPGELVEWRNNKAVAAQGCDVPDRNSAFVGSSDTFLLKLNRTCTRNVVVLGFCTDNDELIPLDTDDSDRSVIKGSLWFKIGLFRNFPRRQQSAFS